MRVPSSVLNITYNFGNSNISGGILVPSQNQYIPLNRETPKIENSMKTKTISIVRLNN